MIPVLTPVRIQFESQALVYPRWGVSAGERTIRTVWLWNHFIWKQEVSELRGSLTFDLSDLRAQILLLLRSSAALRGEPRCGSVRLTEPQKEPPHHSCWTEMDSVESLEESEKFKVEILLQKAAVRLLHRDFHWLLTRCEPLNSHMVLESHLRRLQLTTNRIIRKKWLRRSGWCCLWLRSHDNQVVVYSLVSPGPGPGSDSSAGPTSSSCVCTVRKQLKNVVFCTESLTIYFYWICDKNKTDSCDFVFIRNDENKFDFYQPEFSFFICLLE